MNAWDEKTKTSFPESLQNKGCEVSTQQESWPFQVYSLSVYMSFIFPLQFSLLLQARVLAFCVATELVSHSWCGIFCLSLVSPQRTSSVFFIVSYLPILFLAALKHISRKNIKLFNQILYIKDALNLVHGKNFQRQLKVNCTHQLVCIYKDAGGYHKHYKRVCEVLQALLWSPVTRWVFEMLSCKNDSFYFKWTRTQNLNK